MRRQFTILAILGLSVGFTALPASADTLAGNSVISGTVPATVTATPSTGTVVDYTVKGTFGSLTGFPSTSISNPFDSFIFTFSVDQTLLVPMVGIPSMTGNIPVTFNYSDFSGSTVNFILTDQVGTLVFFDASAGGLFTLEFPPQPSGDDFFLNLFGTSPAGFLGSPGMTGTFPITPGDELGDNSTFTETISTTSAPEPSSLLLLGSGFLALGGFARKRLIARFN
jgi:hypothetical protein